MNINKNALYTKDHEWILKDGDLYQIGIADYAQSNLGDIVYVELPDAEDEIAKEDSIASVESVKAASEVFSPVDCEVVEVNEELEDAPDLLNKSPYESWIAKVKIEDETQLQDLMSAEDYEGYLGEL